MSIFRMPWAIIDESNKQVITSPTLPSDIADRKSVFFADINIPGLNYTPMAPNRNGNTEVSFSLPIINRKTKTGNAALIQQFENLRNQDVNGLKYLYSSNGVQWNSNPKVVYWWGTHRSPLRWWVSACEFNHNTVFTNKVGYSQFTIVDLTLKLIENDSLYRSYQMQRSVSSVAGTALAVHSMTGRGRPY